MCDRYDYPVAITLIDSTSSYADAQNMQTHQMQELCQTARQGIAKLSSIINTLSNLVFFKLLTSRLLATMCDDVKLKNCSKNVLLCPLQKLWSFTI